jgi:hypothetical protein
MAGMAAVLDYSPPAPRSPWPRRLWAALVSCVPGSAAVVAAGLLSTAAMRYFQAREGRSVLTGPPDGRYYQMWVGVIPLLLATSLLAVVWCRAVWRCRRGDRLPVAVIAALLHGCLWCLANIWIIHNGEIAFP